MPVDVALAGLSWPWLLHCDRDLEAWARSTPWLHEGSTIAVACRADSRDCTALVRRSVFQWDAGRSDVRLVELEATGDLLQSVTRWLNVQIPDRRALASTLGEDLAYRPAVLICRVTTGAAMKAVEDAEELRELVMKLDAVRGPVFVIVHPRVSGIVRGGLVADRGWPVGLGDAVLTSDPREAWQQYLHLRIAWESGGNIDTAIACNDVFPALQLGDDDGCEQAFNAFAGEQFAGLTADERRSWRTWYSDARQRRVDLRERAAPWIARALLLAGVPAAVRRVLRAELTCRPLVGHLLNSCFEIEARLRFQIGERGDRCDDDTAHAAFARFADPSSHSLERSLYPEAHPAPPQDVWDFISLGSLLRMIDTHAPELLILRNSLSHGHYANWHAVTLLRTVSARLGH